MSGKYNQISTGAERQSTDLDKETYKMQGNGTQRRLNIVASYDEAVAAAIMEYRNENITRATKHGTMQARQARAVDVLREVGRDDMADAVESSRKAMSEYAKEQRKAGNKSPGVMPNSMMTEEQQWGRAIFNQITHTGRTRKSDKKEPPRTPTAIENGAERMPFIDRYRKVATIGYLPNDFAAATLMQCHSKTPFDIRRIMESEGYTFSECEQKEYGFTVTAPKKPEPKYTEDQLARIVSEAVALALKAIGK